VRPKGLAAARGELALGPNARAHRQRPAGCPGWPARERLADRIERREADRARLAGLEDREVGQRYSDLIRELGQRLGTGLTTLRERLQLIFGDAAQLRLSPGATGGVVVEVDMPAQTWTPARQP
jgi:hypothetical protein